MIPILYESNETNFNHNGICTLYGLLDYEVTEVRNGEFELELIYPVDGLWFSELTDFRIILAEPNEIDEQHRFRIYEIKKSLDEQTVTVYASTATNDLGGNLVEKVVISDEIPQQAMDKMKAALLEPTNYNFVSDIQTKSSTEWERRNPLNCIAGEAGSLIAYWGGEIKRTNDTIFLYSRRGKDNVTTIRPGKNLSGFEMTVSTKGLITAILPYFRYIPENETDYVTVYGAVVRSPLENNYPIHKITPVDFSGDESIITVEDLNAEAAGYFTYINPDCDKPKVNLEIDLMQLSDSAEYAKFKSLERISLTDTVTVWVEKFDIDVVVKVTEVTYNGMKRMVTKLVAGTPSVKFYDDVRNTYQQDINYLKEYVDGVENGVRNQIQLTADKKNTIFRGYTEPSGDIAKVNDLWYKELGSGEVEIRIFDGAYWQPLITAGMNEATRLAVQSALTEAEQATTDAAQAYLDSVTEADRLVAAQTEAFDAEMTLRKGEIAAVQNGINLRVSKGEVVSQLNIDAGRVLIQTDKLLLDADTYIMGTAFVTDVKAKSIEAVNANIASIRTSILTADVITSGMVATSTALITKLFATDATVTTLTGKTAFINSIKAITISADKITAGTLNAANVSLINLNANSITTGTLTGSNMWLNLVTGKMQFTNPTTSDKLALDQGKIVFQNGNNTRDLRYSPQGLILAPGAGNTGTALNTGFILEGPDGSNKYIDFRNTTLNTTQRIVGINETIRFHTAGRVEFRKNRGFNGTDPYIPTRALGFMVGDGTEGIWDAGDGVAVVEGYNMLDFRIRGVGVMQVYRNGISMWGELYMNGNTIWDESDLTLKTNVLPTTVDAIAETKKQKVIEFEWDETNPHNRGKPKGRQFGLSAQDAGILQIPAEKTGKGYMGVNLIQEIHLATLTNQQTIARLESTEKELADLKALLTKKGRVI